MSSIKDFVVVCDKTNNDEEDIQNDILNVEVYVENPIVLTFEVDKDGKIHNMKYKRKFDNVT